MEETDLFVVREWWSALAPNLPDGIAALWFGITDLVVDDRRQRTLYVAGSDRFDPQDPSGDWAGPPYAWWPDDRYVAPPGLAALPDDDYRAVLDYAAALVRSILPPNGLAVDGVAVGFDDGDFTVVWEAGLAQQR
ncbi:MAG: hypothetical protein ABI797_06155 [Chloroflexota bacterium]